MEKAVQIVNDLARLGVEDIPVGKDLRAVKIVREAVVALERFKRPSRLTPLKTKAFRCRLGDGPAARLEDLRSVSHPDYPNR